jgi:predicted acylesterase/phospholipase RssA
MARFFILILALFSASPAHAQAFKRALVIGGGGISPGVALGMIAGAQAAGYKPDLIVTSCGSSLGAALYASFGDARQALAYAKSETFYRSFAPLVKIDSRFALTLKRRLDGAAANPTLLPELFDSNILKVPEDVTGLLPREQFPAKGPRLVVVAARALFGPGMEGRDPGAGPLFRETFITDPATAQLLRGRASTVKQTFPYSRVAMATETLTGIALSQAVRASISDPYYINPARIGGHYYFGGAVDLFPIETAQSLADEVLANFPVGLYTAYEDLAINSTFGFAQSDRSWIASQHKRVKWLDSSGTNGISLDPNLFGLLFLNKMPRTHEKFAEAIERQFQFGYARALEAVKAQRATVNERRHLRTTAVGNR